MQTLAIKAFNHIINSHEKISCSICGEMFSVRRIPRHMLSKHAKNSDRKHKCKACGLHPTYNGQPDEYCSFTCRRAHQPRTTTTTVRPVPKRAGQVTGAATVNEKRAPKRKKQPSRQQPSPVAQKARTDQRSRTTGEQQRQQNYYRFRESPHKYNNMNRKVQWRLNQENQLVLNITVQLQ